MTPIEKKAHNTALEAVQDGIERLKAWDYISDSTDPDTAFEWALEKVRDLLEELRIDGKEMQC